MPYRTDDEALEQRATQIERELAQAREKLVERDRDAASLRDEVSALEKELGQVRAILAVRPGARLGELLARVKIAKPCKADWDAMTGDERVRFCGSCRKDVYDLSVMTAAAAEALIKEKEGDLCVQLYRRSDGTILTSDCDVGIRRNQLRVASWVTAGGLLATTALSLTPSWWSQERELAET